MAVIIAASTVQYVARLGFASDDWAFLGSLTTHGDLSAPGRSVEHDFAIYLSARPVQVAYQTLLYDAFGPNLLGYHLVNAVVLAVMGALGYLVLRELAMPRLPAVAVAVTYGLLPHYSTDRFWWAAFGYSAAMMLALASMYADLRAVRSRVRRYGSGRPPRWRPSRPPAWGTRSRCRFSSPPFRCRGTAPAGWQVAR